MEKKTIEQIIENVYLNGDHDIGSPSKKQLIEAMESYANQQVESAVKISFKKVNKTLRKHGVSKDAPILGVVTSLHQQVLMEINK